MPALLLAAIRALPCGPDFTAALSTSATRGRVSAVIATYNRCPFDPSIRPIGDNPLTWTLDSLLAQAGDALGEIVVVDDGSTDHTGAVLTRYTQAAVPVRVVRFGAHRGLAAARNAGIAAARGGWLLFTDDDCVCAPHYAAGAGHILAHLQRCDPRAAAMTLPFYYRALSPKRTRPRAEIGRLDIAEARLRTGFHTWPTEYLPRPPQWENGTVAPFEVEAIVGTSIIDAAALASVGGFTDLSYWRSAYAEHLYLSASLADDGWRLFYCPDPRISAAHLKFGASGNYEAAEEDRTTVLPGLGRTLGDLIDTAAVPRNRTGARMDDEEFLEEVVGSFFAFYAARDPQAGQAWAGRLWREFVGEGTVYSSTVTRIPPRARRAQIWRAGLERGARFLAARAASGTDSGEISAVLNRVFVDAGQAPLTAR